MNKISTKNIIEAIEKEVSGKTGGELQASIKKIVRFLYNRKLLNKSKEILDGLEEKINKKEGRIKVKIKSAKKISDEKKKELEQHLKSKYKAIHIEGIYSEDKNLLGGMRIEVGEEVIDTTYRNKLNQLEKYLINK